MNDLFNKVAYQPKAPSNIRLLKKVKFTLRREDLSNEDEHIVRAFMFYFDVSYQNLRCNINSYINMLENNIKEKI